MPNGGVPKHMVLFPKDGDVVIYCQAGRMSVVSRNAWIAQKAQAESLCILNEQEGAAVAWFLRYWLGEEQLRPGYHMHDKIQAEFDF